jgi:hypothetical protein
MPPIPARLSVTRQALPKLRIAERLGQAA